MLGTLAAVAAVAVVAAALWVWRTVLSPPVDEYLRSVPQAPAYATFALLLSGTPAVDFQMEALKRYGRVHAVCGFVPGRWVLWLADAQMLRHVLLNPQAFPKLDDAAQRTRFVDQFFGSNIVSNNGDAWDKVHGAMAPAFHWEMLSAFMEGFAQSCEHAIEWVEKYASQQGERNPRMKAALERERAQGAAAGPGLVVDVAPLMQRLTMDVLGKSIFSFDFGTLPQDGKDTQLTTLYNKCIAGMFSPLRLLVKAANHPLLPGNAQLERDIDRFGGLLLDVIEQRRRALADGSRSKDANARDLLDKLVETDLSDQELKNNLNVLFLAGHDTTSTSLSMVLNQLALHPQCQERLRAEVLAVLGEDEHLRYEKQKELVYMNQVIKETLRMYPPVGALPIRVAAQDTEVHGLRIPAGAMIGGGIYQIHHDPEVWGDDANVWDPERWDKGRKQPSGAWMPFGQGQRICLGNNFSLQEQRAFLCALLRRYEVRPGPTTGSKQQLSSGRNFDLGALLFLQVSDLFLRFVPLSEHQ